MAVRTFCFSYSGYSGGLAEEGGAAPPSPFSRIALSPEARGATAGNPSTDHSLKLRDFLLFMPVHNGEAPLEAVLDFYSSIVTLSAEGDSMVSEETLQGLGTTGFLLQTLFGSILRIASPLDNDKDLSGFASSSQALSPEEERLAAEQREQNLDSVVALSTRAASAQSQQDVDDMETAILQAYVTALDASHSEERAAIARSLRLDNESATAMSSTSEPPATPTTMEQHKKERTLKSKLTSYVPDPGYFIAGAAAGGLSRTATAPLDRLKVYLLVNTRSSGETAISALKKGKPIEALRNAGKPFGDALKDLWRAGGIRSLFAGEFAPSPEHAPCLEPSLTNYSGNGLNVIKIMPESAIKVSPLFIRSQLAHI